MQRRFGKRHRIRRVAAFLYIVSCLVYLGWRLTIFNENALILSTMYFVADFLAVTLGVLAIFVSWDYRHRVSPPVAPGLEVDVLIPAYREPVDMIRRTLKGALAITYPHRTFLLDDGRREELRLLAQELGCEYIVRADNRDAKAGNINHALGQTTGEFVAVFDADHIPRPHALDATLGFFSDPRVAMVQTPQDYFNIDALQYANDDRTGALWHDQSFFYNISQPGRDAFEAASCAGTSVVYRRSALLEIGGIPADTVTEDVHTSLKLHKLGYKAPYLNEPIAYGVAASDLADYYRTRHRYGHGNIHALRHERVLTCRGLTLRQRLSYLFLGLIYLEGWQQLLVFLVPSIALIFGIAPFDITVFNVIVVMLFPLWTYALMQEIGCGFSRYWTNEIFAMFRWPIHIVASAGLFGDRLAWRSSRKNIKGRMNWRLLTPQILVVVLSLSALGAGIWRLQQDFSTGPLLAIVIDRVPSAEAVGERVNRALNAAGEWISDRVTGGLPPEPPQAPGEAAANQPVPAPPPLYRLPPRPINWFRPMTTGYTADLVLVAGFWALLNALRGIFVILRVARNVRQSREDYPFRWALPVEIETEGGSVPVEADRLSPSELRLSARSMRQLRASGGKFPAMATIHLPHGPVTVRLGEPESGSAYQPIMAGTSERQEIDDTLYAVAWHRRVMHHDAEFQTPLGWLGGILRLAGGRPTRPARPHWGLLQIMPNGSAGPGDRLPVIVRSAARRTEVDSIIGFRPLDPGTHVLLATSQRREPRSCIVEMCEREDDETESIRERAFDLYRYRLRLEASRPPSSEMLTAVSTITRSKLAQPELAARSIVANS